MPFSVSVGILCSQAASMVPGSNVATSNKSQEFSIGMMILHSVKLFPLNSGISVNFI
jgi:hypothetical protein